LSIITDKERQRNTNASQRAKYKREGKTYATEIDEILEELSYEVRDLQKHNAPPLNLPTGTNASVVEVNRPRSVEPTGDTHVNNYFNDLRITLLIKLDYARWLKKEMGIKT